MKKKNETGWNRNGEQVGVITESSEEDMVQTEKRSRGGETILTSPRKDNVQSIINPKVEKY